MSKLGSISGGTTAGQKDGTHSGRGRGRGRATSHMNSSTGRGSSRGRVRGSGHPARSAASPFSSNEDAGQTGKHPLGGTPSFNSPFSQGQQSNGFGFAGIMNGTSQFGKPSTASGSANNFQGFKTPSIIPRPKNNSVDHSRDPRRRDASQPSVPLKHTIETAPVEDVKAMGGYQDRYENLKLERARQRERAIKQGQMADPNQPTSLNKAITPVGTCTDMCPEFERVERIVQKMVDRSEKYLHPTSGSYQNMETKMLKRFRRSAAGYDEQLPSDIRTPHTLLQTMNYLTRHVISGPEPLGLIHKFVWDRTRSIRNDFSVQQLTQEDHVRMAVLCLERIARFHIVSLHLLSSPSNQEQFDHHQEREQLNNTMLSLMYYYDDNRDRISFPNEDEFRAYYIVFAIHDQRPDLETRVQSWPRKLLQSPKVQVALELFAAAGNTWEYQGALDEKRPNAIAQGFYTRFFSVVDSPSVSYLMACVAEIYFNNVRQTAIRSIWKAYCRSPASQQQKNEEWTLDELTETLYFDDEAQTERFCEEQGLNLTENSDGQLYLNWGSRPIESVALGFQPSSQHAYSEVHVESKRGGRTLAAIILGLNIRQAAKHGMIDNSLLQPRINSLDFASVSEPSDDDGLFVSEEENDISQPERASNGESSDEVDDKPKATESTSSLNAVAPLTSSGSNPVHDGKASNLFGRPSVLYTEPQSSTPSPFSSFPGIPPSTAPAATRFGVPSIPKTSSMEQPSQQALNTSAFSDPKVSFSPPALNPFAASFTAPSSSPSVAPSSKPFSIAAAISNGFLASQVSQTQNNRPSSVFDSVPTNIVSNNTSSGQLFRPIHSNAPTISSSLNPFGHLSTNKVSEIEGDKSATPDSTASQTSAVSATPPSTSSFKPGPTGDESNLPYPSIGPVQSSPSNVVSSLTPSAPSLALSSVATKGPASETPHSEIIATPDQSLLADTTAGFPSPDTGTSYLSSITQSANAGSSEAVDSLAVENTRRNSDEFRTSWIDALRDTVRSKRAPPISRKRSLNTEDDLGELVPDDSLKVPNVQKPKLARPKKTSLALASIAPLPNLPILDEVKKMIQPKAPSTTESETPAASQIDEDELLLSAARIAAESLKNGPSLLGNFPNYSYPDPLRSSVRSERSVHSASDFSRSQSPYSRINGHDVALAPESPLGLGRTLSRTEQRLRLTGGKGLAYKPLPLNLGRITKKKSKKPLMS